ncbi:MAG: ribonuclease Y [Candidatus Nephthysia bennettiae]|uniref:Ribonuclease Y n=1 Tax=Candidatus Nephthysia bennettiae TaxID=3127016 RepID=A0A934KAZ3_9BACT|nr:ribonuclease Y [Candidatus Dormibacteraeota bacterium]MBJ7611238.1 ribonuclease Y [Candidatus Dormibacteraeota bacterium]PZR89815.1 MAG: ribonuclease Y [Candidatus Dormibacteraeota bacterium]
MSIYVVVLLVVITAVLAGGIVLLLTRSANQRNRTVENAERAAQEARANQHLAEVESSVKERLLEAKEEAVRIRTAAEQEARETRAQFQVYERRLHQKEENLERRVDELERREVGIGARERGLEEMRLELEESTKQQLRELERVANMTRQEAQGVLLGQVEQDLHGEIARRVREAELAARDESEKRARAIVTEAIQRIAADQTAETSVSVLPLPNEEIKGRIIGREGRNIRALQQATGIDLIIDDTPEAVVISGFDPVRREVARTALNKLIVDGRIHPARIEETVVKARQEVLQRIKEEGEAAVLEVGIQGLHPEIIRHLGILRFRTSYGQQVLSHSKEVAHLAAMMASEIGADARLAKMAGLLHDIGKSIDHEVEGSHAVIGADLIQRHGVPAPVVHAVRAHHYDEEPHTMEAVLLIAADAISAARPGARRETLDAYVKRLEKLEEIANSFKGVQQSYAIQAGREVRILVRPEQIDDSSAQLMARDIAKRIESELSYPGQIRVTVVRETRATEYAK